MPVVCAAIHAPAASVEWTVLLSAAREYPPLSESMKLQVCTYRLNQLGVNKLLRKELVGRPNVEAEVAKADPRDMRHWKFACFGLIC